jgi:hypothetical protein
MIFVLNIEVPSQELIGRTRGTKLATARGISVENISTSVAYVALHEILAIGATWRIERHIFNVRASNFHVSNRLAKEGGDNICIL